MGDYINWSWEWKGWGIRIVARSPRSRFSRIEVKAFGLLWTFSVQRIYRGGVEISGLGTFYPRDDLGEVRYEDENPYAG